jgi:hypothetical protein
MSAFHTTQEAKEYLVQSIVAEAERQGTPLSEVERKMLYFTETAWAPTGINWIELVSTFDSEYDREQYERNISGLIRSLRAHTRTSDRNAFDTWTKAARAISQEDHYLLVMMKAAGATVRPRYDLLKLIATALAIVCAMVALLFLMPR